MTATDWYDDALAFARVNALRNALPPPATHALDWRAPTEALGRFDLVADPGRQHLPAFVAKQRDAGWMVQERAVLAERQPGLSTVTRVTILALRRT